MKTMNWKTLRKREVDTVMMDSGGCMASRGGNISFKRHAFEHVVANAKRSVCCPVTLALAQPFLSESLKR